MIPPKLLIIWFVGFAIITALFGAGIIGYALGAAVAQPPTP